MRSLGLLLLSLFHSQDLWKTLISAPIEVLGHFGVIQEILEALKHIKEKNIIGGALVSFLASSSASCGAFGPL